MGGDFSRPSAGRRSTAGDDWRCKRQGTKGGDDRLADRGHAARTVAVYTQKPAEILAELNTRLHERVGGGFVTCLILLVPPDGSIVMAANVGHIAPYVNGREWELGGSLPLGIIPEMEYEESTLSFADTGSLQSVKLRVTIPR